MLKKRLIKKLISKKFLFNYSNKIYNDKRLNQDEICNKDKSLSQIMDKIEQSKKILGKQDQDLNIKEIKEINLEIKKVLNYRMKTKF